jgi:hypothetical protein
MVKSHQKTIQPMKLYSSHRWILHVTGEAGIPGGFGNKGDKGDRGLDGTPGNPGIKGESGRNGFDGQSGESGMVYLSTRKQMKCSVTIIYLFLWFFLTRMTDKLGFFFYTNY